MKYLVLIVLFICPSMLFAQARIIDSLNSYKEKVKPGRDQLDLYTGLSRLYINNNQRDEALELLDAMEEIGEAYDIPEALAYKKVIEQSIYYLLDYDVEKAIKLNKEAVDIAKKSGNRDAQVLTGFLLAETYIWEKGDTDLGFEILLELLPILDKTVTQKNEGNLYKVMGVAYARKGEFDQALRYNQKALDVFEEMKSNPRIDPRIGRPSAQGADYEFQVTNILDNMGNLYLDNGQPDIAIEYKLKTLEIIKKMDSPGDLAWIHTNLSSTYSTAGMYEKALEHVQKARLIYEDLGESSKEARSITNMAELFMKLEDYERAREYAEKTVTYFKNINHVMAICKSQLLLASISLKQQDTDYAGQLIGEAQFLVDSLNNKPYHALYEEIKGTYFDLLGDPEQSTKHFRSALILNEELNRWAKVGAVEYGLARVYYHQNELDSALTHARYALGRLKSAQDFETTGKCYLLLSQIYEAKKEFESAFENHKAFFRHNDSLYTANAQAKLKEEQVRQNVVSYQNEKEVAEQYAEVLAGRNQIYVIMAIVLGAIFLMMGYLYLNLRKVKAKIQDQNVELTQLNQTKDKFFGIIAHDLRSPLLGLQSVGSQINFFMKKKDNTKLEELSVHIENTTKMLTNLLDNLLNWALLQNGMIPYHPEKVDLNGVIESVVELLNPVAEMKGVHLKNGLEKSTLVYADEKAVHTIIRNIVSNALKYTDREGQVVISAQSLSEKTSITINDSGTGIAAELLPKLFDLDKKSVQGTQGEKGTGLGLVLCKELVELNKGTIDVESDLGKGSRFIFELPNYSDAA